MNNEEHIAFFRAAEGVQQPILQRSISDARAMEPSTHREAQLLPAVQSDIENLEQLFTAKDGQQPAKKVLHSLEQLINSQSAHEGPCIDQWARMGELVHNTVQQLNLVDKQWELLAATQKAQLAVMVDELRAKITEMMNTLGIGSDTVTSSFDAPIYYSLQRLCDFFLPNRVRMEAATDNRIASYVATLQMRLSRLLADGRYDFITRIERHADPLGSYLKQVLGEGDHASEGWPGENNYLKHLLASRQVTGPSVTIFDLSLVASDVLENVTSLLGRLILEFAVRSDPRAEHPILLVLEEAHRFIPTRQDQPSGSRSTAVFERIAKEGRKFGISLLLASQRPSELSEKVVAQCGTVIAHRLTHEADQNLLRHATAFSSRALLDQLSSLAQQHALITGVSTGVPVAVRIRDVADPPKSKDPDFIQTWADESKRTELPGHIDRIVAAWQGAVTGDDSNSDADEPLDGYEDHYYDSHDEGRDADKPPF
jgi:hypothetical protein